MQARIELTETEVHVWSVWLTGSGAAYRALLSPEERDRASRFAFERHRKAYEISQGALRVLLSRYLDTQPQDFEFAIGPNGKPALPGSGIGFNKSHSSQLALYAFTAGCEIGVDVEEVRNLPDSQKIADRYFSQADAAEVAASESSEVFFRCWTRTEACVKESGAGLSGLGKSEDWTVHEVEPAPGYVGAVAYRGLRRDVLFQGVLVS
jgi:4'-phosphopantetheinyl transferase